MGRKINISLEEIINRVGGLEFVENDFEYIFNNIEKAKEFLELCIEAKASHDLKRIKKYLLENEKYVNKENLILILAKNCTYKIAELKERVRQEELKKVKGQQEIITSIGLIKEMKEQIKNQEKRLKELIRMGKGIDTVLALYSYDEKNRYYLDIADSREFIDGKNISHSKKRKRLEDIDILLKKINQDGKLSLKYLLEIIDFQGLNQIFITKEFGDKVIRMVLENRILQNEKLTPREFEYIRDKYPEKYEKMLEKLDSEEFSDDVLEVVLENAKYVDIDRLLLLAAQKFENALEKDMFNYDEAKSVGFVIEKILSKIEDKNTSVKIDENKYSVQDLEKCLARFTYDSYLTKDKISNLREGIMSGDIGLCDIEPSSIYILFTDKELEELAMLSAENLNYVLEELNLEPEKNIDLIIEGYEDGNISLDKISKLKFLYDLSKGINFDKLNEYSILANQENAKQEDIEKYRRYLDLYKEILIKDKQKEDLEENSNSIMENLINYYNKENKESYIKCIEDYYKEGILTLDSIVDWNGEEVITRLYNDKVIDLEDILSIGIKLGFDYIQKLYIQLVNSDNISYDERIAYIARGFIGEDEVIKLYNKGMIMDDDLMMLAQKAIIREQVAKEIIESRDLEERIKNSRAKVSGWCEADKLFDVNGLRKKQNEYTGIPGPGGDGKPKLIIDPNLRQTYIEKLGLYRINVKCEEDSPFYNYEFYATPDETGAIGPNSVIIAERYYNNKDTEKTYAVNNATYFFKFKDFLVLTNLSKKDMLEERENKVFRANHTITTNKKQGAWAKSVLENVMKVMLGNQLDGLSERDKRKKMIEQMRQMYLKEEIDEIFDLCERIDSGEGILVIENRKRKNSPNFDDDDDGLR